MLSLDGLPWSCGAAPLLLDHVFSSRTFTMMARCTLAGELDLEAFLDTGCSLSILGGEVGDFIEPLLGEAEETRQLSTRIGVFGGSVYSCPVVLLAERGRACSFDARLLVAREWPGPVVLGYPAALDRIRLAFDPGTSPAAAQLYFGRL